MPKLDFAWFGRFLAAVFHQLLSMIKHKKKQFNQYFEKSTDFFRYLIYRDQVSWFRTAAIAMHSKSLGMVVVLS